MIFETGEVRRWACDVHPLRLNHLSSCVGKGVWGRRPDEFVPMAVRVIIIYMYMTSLSYNNVWSSGEDLFGSLVCGDLSLLEECHKSSFCMYMNTEGPVRLWAVLGSLPHDRG